MKKGTVAIFSLLLLAGCSADGKAPTWLAGDSSSSTITAKLRACSVEEAYKKVQSGTVWTSGLQASADEISSTCIKKLALESAGVSSEATDEAKYALSNFMDAAANLKKGFAE